MPPRKIINKSRPLGGKPRNSTSGSKSKKTKTDSTPKDSASKEKVDPLAIATSLVASSHSNGTSSATTSNNSRTSTRELTYTGLSQISHGLNIPSFDVNTYFAQDLFSNSSPLQENEKEEIDKEVQSVEKKRQTLRLVGANLALNTDVVKIGTDYRKFEGAVLDYAIAGLNNEIKFINYKTTEVNRDIAINRYDQSQERLIQGEKVLAGMQSITPLIDKEWDARRSLKQSQIKSLEVAAVQAREALEPKLLQLSQNFKEELAELN